MLVKAMDRPKDAECLVNTDQIVSYYMNKEDVSILTGCGRWLHISLETFYQICKANGIDVIPVGTTNA